jgi:dTDP-4-dehydrorhamnose 3,5-epimerase
MIVKNHKTFLDNRGSYTPIDVKGWDQCSISINTYPFTFRGLHYQTNPPQTKYVKVIQGSIIDFLVDLETKEVEFAKLNLNSSIEVPSSKAHGFLTLEPNTIVVYNVIGEYNPESEHSIPYYDILEVKQIIESYSSNLIISEKDQNGK